MGHFVSQVWVVAEPREYAVPLVHPEPEAAHIVCSDPGRAWSGKDVPRTRLKAGAENLMGRLAPSHQCRNCGEVFLAGDRIVEVYAVEGVGVDPQIGAPAIQCAGEAEYAHKDCADRALSKGREALVVLG